MLILCRDLKYIRAVWRLRRGVSGAAGNREKNNEYGISLLVKHWSMPRKTKGGRDGWFC